MIIYMRIFSIVGVFTLFLFASPALAQFSSNSFLEQDYGIQLQPEFPRPGEQVTATFVDYRGGSTGANITWVFAGGVIPEAENQRNVIVTAGKAGETQVVEVILTKVGGNKEVLTKTIKPIYLDIIIEPQTRTPSFYLGRSLPSIGSIVNVTALVTDKNLRNPDLIYTWRLGQQVLEGGAVRGRNQVSYTTPMGGNEVLTLQVSELNGTVLARRSIFAPSVEPIIRFYTTSPLFGVSNRAAVSIPLISNSITVQAEPFYLDSRVYNNPAITEWKIGNTRVNNPSSNPYEITLERSGAEGSIDLDFHVRDTTQVLQGAKGTTRINF
jgi:hypothetical protein